MRKVARKLLAAAIAATVPCVMVAAEARVALVIGNDEYKTLTNLNNAVRDARAMAAKLTELGFDTTLKENVGERDLHRALQEYETALKRSDVGLVYYAGHGVEVEGENYLIPADAEIEAEVDLRSEALNTEEILKVMQQGNSPLNIMILDACRDNPLPEASRSASSARGLALEVVPAGVRGTAILFAAAPGKKAQDGPPGGHGIFTSELLNALDQSGLTLEQVFKRVNRGVAKRTNDEQRPWSLTSMEGDFYFRPDDGSVVAEPEPPRDPEMDAEDDSQPSDPAPTNALDVEQRKFLRGMERASAEDDYEQVLKYGLKLEELGGALPLEARYYRGLAYMELRRNQEAEQVLKGYLEELPRTAENSERSDEVLDRLLELDERLEADDAAYEAAKDAGTAAAYGQYAAKHPNGVHVEEARRLHAEKQDDEAYRQALADGTVEAYGKYLTDYPSGRHAEEAQRRLQDEAEDRDKEAYERARKEGTSASYEEYLREYPTGLHAEEARSVLAEAKDDEAFERAKRTSTSASYGLYLRQYPSGRHVQEARLRQTEAKDDEAFERARRTNTSASYGAYLSEYPSGRHAAEARRLRDAGRKEEEQQPGRVFRDCAECPEMVVVPAGWYMMGSPSSEEERYDWEGPRHRVTIARPFAVGVYEVMFAEWDECVAGGGCEGYRPDDEGWGRGKHPVINVSWDDAQLYVRWLSGRTGERYRLLSEAEWEYVARAGTTTPFHTGATISINQANYDGNYTYGSGREGTYRERTVTVGRFRANAFRLYDVHGNVWEWTQDCWNDSYRGAPTDGRAREGGECNLRVLRGGSWNSPPQHVRSAIRGPIYSGERFVEYETEESEAGYGNVGFRSCPDAHFLSR